MILSLFLSLSLASPTVQLDFTPSSATDEEILRDDTIHRLSYPAQKGFRPWIGYRTENWIFLSSLTYNIWEYRSWTAEEMGLENLGALTLQQQAHRIFERNNLLLSVGAGALRNFAISNRRSTLFTEEELEDYKEQAERSRDQIESLGLAALFSIQYPVSESIFLGIGYDSYALFQQRDHQGILEINTRLYTEPKIFVRTEL